MATINNLLLEQSILSVFLIFEDSKEYISKLQISDFTKEEHRKIIKVMKELDAENKEINLINVKLELGNEVNIDYLMELSGLAATSVSIDSYVRELKNISLDREIEKRLIEIKRNKLKGKDRLMAIIGELTELEQSESIEMDSKSLSDNLIKAMEDIEEAQKGEDEGISTGLKGLDNMLGKLKAGSSTIVGARPSIGKTALGLNIASNVAFRQDKNVVFFTLEMDALGISKRLLSSQALVDATKMQTEKGLDETDYNKLFNALNFMATKEDNLRIVDNTSASIGEIYSEARRLNNEREIDLVIIDYLQYIKADGSDTRQQIKTISRGIKNIARTLQVPVITIAALKRAEQGREVKPPQMSDLRDASDIEYDADKIIMLHREFQYNTELIEKENQADVYIRKNRSGQTGYTELIWKGEYTRFFDKVEG